MALSMQGAIYSTIRALAGLESGTGCRACKEPIDRADRFGTSEGVCSPCRHAAGS